MLDEEAHKMLDTEKIAEMLGGILEDDEIPHFPFMDGDFDDLCDESDYHNKAVNFAKKGKKKDALKISIEGAERFPKNSDLCALVVRFASETGDDETAQKYYARLMSRFDRCTWSWSEYTFTLDYLMEDAAENEQLCRELISDYNKYLPYEERATVSECNLEEKLGNFGRCKELLNERISKTYNAPQCAAKLITIYMKEGNFEEALRISYYYEIASCEVQSSTTYTLHLYERALIEEALMRKEYYVNKTISVEAVEHVTSLYNKLLKIPDVAMLLGVEIKNRLHGLKFITIPE